MTVKHERIYVLIRHTHWSDGGVTVENIRAYSNAEQAQEEKKNWNDRFKDTNPPTRYVVETLTLTSS